MSSISGSGGPGRGHAYGRSNDGPPPMPEYSSANQDAINSQIQSTSASIMSMYDVLAELQRSLAEEQSAKPSRGEFGDGEDGDKKFAAAMSAWQGRIAGLKSRIATQEAKIRSAEAKLADLQNNQLPAAKAQDDANYQRKMNAWEQAVEGYNKAQGAGETSATEETKDEDDDKPVEETASYQAAQAEKNKFTASTATPVGMGLPTDGEPEPVPADDADKVQGAGGAGGA